jgi:tetratricopeptide (TPR) repeat protein
LNFFTFTKKALQDEKQKNFTKAYNLYVNSENTTNSIPVKIKLISKRAWCLEQVGNHESAVELIKSLTILYEGFSESFLLSALYFIKLKKFKQAKLYLHSGIEQFPDSTDLYLTLAFLLKETERWDESIQVLKKALSRDTLTKAKNGIGKQDIWNELGHLYFERGNYNSCVACLKKAISINGDLMSCYSTISKAYLNIEDPRSTIKYIDLLFQKFEFLDMDDYIIKARAHARLKEFPQAMECLQVAYEEGDSLFLKTEDMVDFSELVKNGFFDSFQNLEYE